MTTEKDLFTRALGTDEPPLRLDYEGPARQVRSRRFRPAWAVVAAAAAVATVLGGAALINSTGSTALPSGGELQVGDAEPEVRVEAPTEREIAYCYRTADIRSTEVNQRVPIGINGNGREGRGDVASRAMSICGDSWRNNYNGWQSVPVTTAPVVGGHQNAVPALVACVLNSDALKAESGAVGVFPGDPTTCARMGLATAEL